MTNWTELAPLSEDPAGVSARLNKVKTEATDQPLPSSVSARKESLSLVEACGLERASQDLRKLSALVKDLIETAAYTLRDTEGDDPDTDSDDDSDSPTGVLSLEDIVEDLKTDVQCLVDLGPGYDEPIRDRRLDEEEARVPNEARTWDPARYMASRIRHRYPKGDSELLKLLGHQNWDRLREVYATREANSGTTQRSEADEASTVAPSRSAFHDSGLGTSVATPTSYAETVLSYHVSQGESVKIPPLPAEAAQGKAFRCPICGQSVQISDKSRWK